MKGSNRLLNHQRVYTHARYHAGERGRPSIESLSIGMTKRADDNAMAVGRVLANQPCRGTLVLVRDSSSALPGPVPPEQGGRVA